ncbi:hypothetical protein M5K25_010877 [Dendrobium thyrsiflorum]|uniref:Uncharacterized protein n=1 Tax=Dendrobium thyrsiflorum TaxID=117978 RepID=A0ABD0V896_DENTH
MGTGCDAYDETGSLISTPERGESRLRFHTEYLELYSSIGYDYCGPALVTDPKIICIQLINFFLIHCILICRLVTGIENAATVEQFYDKSNWCIILQKR